MTILDVYELATGRRPGELVSSTFRPDAQTVTRLLHAHEQDIDSSQVAGVHEVYPLLSHHTYANRSLFGTDIPGRLSARTLSLLVLFDGVVAANPMVDVGRMVERGDYDGACRLVEVITPQLAAVEPLIDSGTLRLTRMRPHLADSDRQHVLDLLGVDAQMREFVSFMDAAVTVKEFPESFRKEYAPQVYELHQLLGVNPPALHDLDSAVEAVRALGAAIIELSWQVAVAAQDDGCDVAVLGATERQLLNRLMERSMQELKKRVETWSAKTHHFDRIEFGNVPNLDGRRLSVADALAIRKDDTFERFREVLTDALRDLDFSESLGQAPHYGRYEFEKDMHIACKELCQGVKKASFSSHLKDTSVTAGFGVVGTITGALLATGISPATLASVGAAGAGWTAGAAWRAFRGRRRPDGIEAARRYFAMLGGESRPAMRVD